MLEFPKDLYAPIANFIQYVIYHPLLWQDLSGSVKIPDELMIDERTIELGKFIMMGEDCYYRDPAPIRMYGEQRIIVSKDEIKSIALQKYEFLQKLKDTNEVQITIQSNCRGIDIILANFVKQWDKIIYIEPNEYMLSRVKEYFTQDNIVFKNE